MEELKITLKKKGLWHPVEEKSETAKMFKTLCQHETKVEQLFANLPPNRYQKKSYPLIVIGCLYPVRIEQPMGKYTITSLGFVYPVMAYNPNHSNKFLCISVEGRFFPLDGKYGSGDLWQGSSQTEYLPIDTKLDPKDNHPPQFTDNLNMFFNIQDKKTRRRSLTTVPIVPRCQI